jgi:RPA family protein
MSAQPNRETAYRVFAAEFDDATLSYAESDEERAPNYVVTPTGVRINRLFAVGVLTEIESVNDEQLRTRIVDPTGAFVVYAGQYQPEALSFLERAEAPAFVAVTGKARTFQPEDSNRVFTSVRPETLSEVDAATRDRFAVETAAQTIERMETMQDALSRDERDDALHEALLDAGVEAGLAAGIPRAIAHYGTTPAYLDAIQEMALDVARVVAGEREEVRPLGVAPGDGSAADRTAPEGSGDSDETGPTATGDEETDPVAGTANDEAATDDTEQTVEGTPTNDAAATPDIETETSVDAESGPETAVSTAESVQSESEDRGSAAGSLDGTDEPSETAASGAESGEIDEATAEDDFRDSEEFELDEAVREEIEEQYGTDFESAAEVDGPGEADIETPTPDEASPNSAGGVEPSASETPEATKTVETAGTDTTADAESDKPTDDASGDESDDGTVPDEGGETDADIDPEEAVVAAMDALDDGDGAEREAIIERVVEDHGLTREEADEGIQSALMSGACYRADDDMFKPI